MRLFFLESEKQYWNFFACRTNPFPPESASSASVGTDEDWLIGTEGQAIK
ncbi:MAG: hypothetical protein ACUZ8I_04315 [Candidatus Scalindua sp.]